MALTPIGLYVRCVGWGLTAGAAAGAATSAYSGFVGHLDALAAGSIGARLGEAMGGALTGAPFGMTVAVAPTLMGGLLVLSIVWGSHPQPASLDPVRRDLRVACYGLTAVLAGAVLFAAVVWGGMDLFSDVLPYVLVATASLFLVLWPAVESIARGWAGEDDQASPVLSGRPNGSW